MRDMNDPIFTSIVIFIFCFICILGIFYLFSPSWVFIIDQNTGKSIISWKLVFMYSITFSLIFSIAVFLKVAKKRELNLPPAYDIKMNIPSAEFASAYVT